MKTSTSFKLFVAILSVTVLMAFYLKYRILSSHQKTHYLDSLAAALSKQESNNPLFKKLPNTAGQEIRADDNDADSVFLYFMSENNFVQVMGEDDMPVISFSIPEGEPLSDQVLTENTMMIDYGVGGSAAMIRQFRFTMLNGQCDFTKDGIYKEWRHQAFSNIRFTKEIGKETDVAPFQSRRYAFERLGHCFIFEVLFPPVTDRPVDASLYNEAEEINFIEHVLESVKIY